MAAGKPMMYNTALKYILQGNIGLTTHTIDVYPLHSGYTPSTASHSTLAQITAYRSTASNTVVNARALTTVKITGSGVQQVIFDAADIAGFSSGGDTFKCKYLAFVARSASGGGGQDNLLIGFMDTETGASTGVEVTQLNVTWGAGGIFAFNSNQ